MAEWRPDVADLNSAYASDVENVLVNADGYTPAPSLVTLTAALPSQPLGGCMARQLDGTVNVFAATATKLYKLNNTDLTWTDVSQAATTYAATTTAPWDFAQFGNYVVAVNQNDNPQVFELGTATAFSDLAGSPPKAGAARVWGDFLCLMQLTNNPNRVQWSALNDITGWTPGTNNSDYQDFPDGGAVQGSDEQTNPIIMQEKAIRLANFVPGSTEVFTFQKIHDNAGAKSSKSIAYRGGFVFYADEGGFFQIGTGTTSVRGLMTQYQEVQPIGFQKVDKTIFEAMQAADISNIQGTVDPFFSRVYWLADLSGSGVYDTMLVYDWNLQKWSKVDVSVYGIFPLATTGYTLEGLDAVSTNIDTLPFSLDSKVWQGGAPILGAFTSDFKLASFSGQALEAKLTTQETGSTDGSITLVSSMAAIVDTDNYTAATGSRMTRGTPVQWTAELAPNAVTGRVDRLTASRFQRARITIPAAERWTVIQGVDIIAKPAGRR